jgi:hypothetical protein
MPLVKIEDLPDSSRVWVFGADHDLDDSPADLLLRDVAPFLSQWHAHGSPLTAARDWKYGRFLTVAVDQSTAGASGCSIDGLFRSLKSLESTLGASMVTSGLIFYRDRKEPWNRLIASGSLSLAPKAKSDRLRAYSILP